MATRASLSSATLSLEQQLAVQYSISRAFAEADRLDHVAPLVLKTLADAFGWRTSGLWVLDDDGRTLRCAATYSSTPALDPWVADSLSRRFEIGTGLPGQVWATGRPAWISDTDTANNFPRRAVAKAAGLRHGFAFPVRVRGSIGAVVELFAADVREVDTHQIGFLEAIGHQLGSFIERIEARRAVALSEARKTGVLAAAVDAIVSADQEGRILEFNPAAEELFGRRRADAIGRTVAEILVPDELRAIHETGLRRYVETGQARILGQRVRTWALRADGSRVAVELTVTEIRIDGQPMFTAFIRDITGERQAETARDRFLEILSHELRTPVTAIYGGAKVLTRSSIDDATRIDLITDIGAEADRLYRLVEDLIVLSRAERGAQQMSLEPVRLDRVAKRVVAAFGGQVPNLELRLTEKGPPLAVSGDETYVEQLLRNLLSNAVKYGGRGGLVEVEITNCETEAEVRVLDRGPGIDQQEARRLFDMDYRSPLTEGLAQGSGIGLFVARWLVEGMGGRVWALPRAGGGSEFGFALRHVDPDAPGDDVLNLG
jgi:PAS domain S-box-containing protein